MTSGHDNMHGSFLSLKRKKKEMSISTPKYRQSSESGLNTTSGCGGPVKLVQINSLEEIRLAITYGASRYYKTDWHEVYEYDTKYFDELLYRILKKKGEVYSDGCVVFMAEV